MRVALALAVALASAPSARAADGPASEPDVRVLVLTAAAPVEVEGAGSRPLRVVPARDGLRVGGRPVGSWHRLAGPGPHRIDGRRYRGALEFYWVHGDLEVVNEVPLEAYVAGILLEEISESFGEQALRAQAVAGRTYALHRRARAAGARFHVEAGTAGQVYGGLDSERRVAWEAVAATRGEYLAWAEQPILAAFHAASGGRTASAAEVWGQPLPYLVSLEVDDERDSPEAQWRIAVPGSDLAGIVARLARPVGRIVAVEVAERTPSGRVRRLRVVGHRGAALVEARALRRALGPRVLRSTLFEVRSEGDRVVFTGAGYGHGVGMSQWAARAMARRGAPYRAILARFYPGAVLRRLPHAVPDSAQTGMSLAAGAGLR